ncbi:hypothetical protein [Bailinhaonella thermotolerans]|uniref:Uncharacterized protein n=1 Tax=Bailinhaonella thermotolerans TaxID=1070861 RepID=A0A3A3ZXV6_9ACTN|nr:hypothetical protein [Bailinhaonella thermotolerans]RJL19976.1 hypothetical protein D5H75_40010 [Bailinhaonella thermotolerans]
MSLHDTRATLDAARADLQVAADVYDGRRKDPRAKPDDVEQARQTWGLALMDWATKLAAHAQQEDIARFAARRDADLDAMRVRP